MPNILDNESDAVERSNNPNSDGLPNYLDSDSDEYAVSDQQVNSSDPDNNGTVNYFDKSNNNTPTVTTENDCVTVSGTGPIEPLLFILLLAPIATL